MIAQQNNPKNNTTITIIPAEPGWWVCPRGRETQRVIAWQVFYGAFEGADVLVKAITVDGPTVSRAAYGPTRWEALVEVAPAGDFDNLAVF